MAEETVFKKSLFGGFDRRQVIEYISYLTSHCPDTATREEILKLRKHIEELEQLIVQRDAVIKDLKRQRPAEPVNPVIISLQEIVRNGKKLKKSNEEIELITSSIQKEIDEKQPKIESLLTKITSISTEIASIQSNLRSISAKLSAIDFEHFESSANSEEYENTEEVITSEISAADPAETVDVSAQNDGDDEEYEFPVDDDTEYVPLDIDYSESGSGELINSVDNFFIELEKIADAQIFDLTTLLDNEDNDNATE